MVMLRLNMQKKWRGLTPPLPIATSMHIDETAAPSIL